jgi:hypothetical protein
MKKVLLAAGLLAVGTVLATVPANAAPTHEKLAASAPAVPIPCGYFEDGDVAFYQNCSQFGAGIRIVHRNGSITTDCLPGYAGWKIGTSYDIQTAYTYRTC